MGRSTGRARRGSTITVSLGSLAGCGASAAWRRTHRISRFYWQRKYGIFSEVPNSYRTWIKASAGASNTSRDTFALQLISPMSAKSRQRFCRIRPWECIKRLELQ